MSKERLTEKCWRNLDPWECCGQHSYCIRGCHDKGGCANGCIVPKLYVRLAKYEDLEEQGLILRLPCKVGDTVYTACARGVESGIVSSITIMKNNICIYDRYGCFIGTSDNIFLTQSEAEEKLRELEG